MRTQLLYRVRMNRYVLRYLQQYVLLYHAFGRTGQHHEYLSFVYTTVLYARARMCHQERHVQMKPDLPIGPVVCGVCFSVHDDCSRTSNKSAVYICKY